MRELTSRFDDALRYAARVHAGQVRKGSGVPYISHLLAVASLVLEDGGSEDEAIAALLHDAAEDQGGRDRLVHIERRFGPRVAQIVEGCSDTLEQPKPAWTQRKERFLDHLRSAPPEVLRVTCADKLHNARSILAARREQGEGVWDRFNAPPEQQLRYYSAVAHILGDRHPGMLADELERVVDELSSRPAGGGR